VSLRHAGLALAFVALLAAPLWVLGYNVNQSVAPDLAEPVADLGAPYAGSYAAPRSVLEDEFDSAGLVCVSLVVRTVDPRRLTAPSSILVTPTQAAQDALAASVARGESATEDQVTLRIEYRLGATDVAIRMPLADLLAADRGRLPEACPTDELHPRPPYQADVELPVVGQPRAFPNDWYWLTAYVAMFQPAGGAEGDGRCCLPFALDVTRGTEDLRMAIQLDTVVDDAFLPLELKAQRPWRIVFYTYVVAIVPPLILGGLLFWQLGRRRRSEASPAPHELLFGMAAILLALLPLRQVLVPAEIQSLTRVDAAFAAIIMLLLWAAIAWSVHRPAVVAGPARAQAPSRTGSPPAPRRGTLLVLAVLVWLTRGRKRR
jgi:hypothetical protein